MIHRRSLMHAAAVLAAALAVTTAEAADLNGWGVLLLHGKGASSGSMSPVAGALSAAGATVINPTFFWSSGYETHDQGLAQIGAYVAQLKAQGARRIALVGHSLGANMALGYAASRRGVQAVVAMGPGHQPDRTLAATGESVARAKAMIDAGRGNETASFADNNQGRVFQVTTTAAAYYSFFNPNGRAVIARNAGAGGAKVLWVVGTADRGAQMVARGGKTIMVGADHRSTPGAGAQEVVEWLGALK